MKLTQPDGRCLRCLVALAMLLLIPGCANFGYYLQSISGQLQLNSARQPVERVIADPDTPDLLKRRLERASAIRQFASSELHLPDNGSYRSYADLKRPFVVWNVFAAEEFSVEPREWCFPIAGCVGYRGYFSKDAADAYAREMRAQGLEVRVGGVPAYSTLGWFDDPLLNTFIQYPEYELARLIFHELAHQVAYVKGDSEFNESFAVAVEIAGVDRWIARRGDATMQADAARTRERRAQFAALVLDKRDRLASLYLQRIAPAAMRERKTEIFAELQRDYTRLKQQWGDFAGYDAFFNGANNAHLASISIYHALVPAMQRLLARQGGDLNAFFAEVRRLAALPKSERDAALAGH
jgi:predicted aminopeptidase